MSKKNKSDILFSNDHGVALLPQAGAIVSLKPPRPTETIEQNFFSQQIAFWGQTNQFPQEVIADVRKDPDLGTLLNKCAQLMYSSGITFGTIAYKSNGEEFLEPLTGDRLLKVRDWLRKSNINRYLYEACKDLAWFYNVFPEIVLSRDRSMIVQIAAQPSEDCRWELQDQKTGAIKNCYINANYATTAVPVSEFTKVVPVLDPYYDAAESLRADTRGTNYIYPLSIPSPGNKYYQLADWNAIRVSGWLEVSQQIPKFKQALLENQITLKYHIEISDMYWETKFGNWKSRTEAERTGIKTAELQLISDTLAGAAQSGKSFWSSFKTDFNQAKEMSLIKINVIDDKLKSGQFLEDGKDASLYKMSAIGLHPALIGSMPNNGLGGAGSNIREAYNLHVLTVQFYQDLILEPLYLVRDYNSWGSDIDFRFKNSFMNTLDAGTETTQTTKA